MAEEKKKRGRPAFELTEEQKVKIEDYAKIGCTEQEIAIILDVPRTTLQRNNDFKALYKKGTQHLKASLRRTMVQKALGDKNPSMLIWLSKQYLDFSDTPRETDLREREVVLKEKEFKKGEQPPTKHDFDVIINALRAEQKNLFGDEDEAAANEVLESKGEKHAAE